MGAYVLLNLSRTQYRNTKLCCCGYILELFLSTTANKIDFEHTRDYKS